MIAKDINAIMFILICTILGVLVLFVANFYDVLWPWGLLSLFMFVPGLFFLFFFRDPPRRIGEGYVAPADGKVILIDQQGKFKRVVIFMNIHNVHVNRVPCDGEVVSIEHVEGAFSHAGHEDAEHNEKVIMILKTSKGNVKVVQIAGMVARRIVPYLEEGDVVKKGDRLGHIALGSRVDLYMPKKVKVEVELDQRVKGGTTTIAR